MKVFLKFSMVGGVNTAFSYLVFYLLIKLDVFYLLSAVLSYIFGTVLSYILNARHTFKKQRRFRAYVIYVLVNLISLGYGLLLLYIIKNALMWHVLIAQALVVGLRLPLTFLLAQKIVFSSSDQ